MSNLRDVDNAVKPELKVGSRVCQCGACGLYFTGVAPFDKHQVWVTGGNNKSGNIVCLSPTEMLAAGMGRNKYGVWQYTRRSAEHPVDDLAHSA